MRYHLLLLLVVAVCEAGRITRGVAHELNVHPIYHGHGATSYQSVRVDNHDSVIVPANYGDQVELQGLEDHDHRAIIPGQETHSVGRIDISDAAPYEEFVVADVKLKSDELGHYHLDHEEHGLHLRK